MCKTSPVADQSTVEFFLRRLIDNTETRLPSNSKADHHCELPTLRNELFRSIHRIHDPDSRHGETLRIVGLFLTEDSVIRKLSSNRADKKSADLNIRTRDRV